MRDRTWRDVARPIIEKVLKECKGMDEEIVRGELRRAYPFGARRCFPYKVWLDEIKIQMGKKKRPVKGRHKKAEENTGLLFKGMNCRQGM